MAKKTTPTVELGPVDAEALARAAPDAQTREKLVRRGIRLVAGDYYRRARRPPATRLFVPQNPLLGDESALFHDLTE